MNTHSQIFVIHNPKINPQYFEKIEQYYNKFYHKPEKIQLDDDQILFLFDQNYTLQLSTLLNMFQAIEDKDKQKYRKEFNKAVVSQIIFEIMNLSKWNNLYHLQLNLDNIIISTKNAPIKSEIKFDRFELKFINIHLQMQILKEDQKAKRDLEEIFKIIKIMLTQLNNEVTLKEFNKCQKSYQDLEQFAYKTMSRTSHKDNTILIIIKLFKLDEIKKEISNCFQNKLLCLPLIYLYSQLYKLYLIHKIDSEQFKQYWKNYKTYFEEQYKNHWENFNKNIIQNQLNQIDQVFKLQEKQLIQQHIQDYYNKIFNKEVLNILMELQQQNQQNELNYQQNKQWFPIDYDIINKLQLDKLEIKQIQNFTNNEIQEQFEIELLQLILSLI